LRENINKQRTKINTDPKKSPAESITKLRKTYLDKEDKEMPMNTPRNANQRRKTPPRIQTNKIPSNEEQPSGKSPTNHHARERPVSTARSDEPPPPDSGETPPPEEERRAATLRVASTPLDKKKWEKAEKN